MLIEEAFACFGLALVLSLGLFALHQRDRVTPDEGYVWYGTLRLLEGEWPHRDFKSYEPGRYFWYGMWAAALGKGLGVFRLATHAFYFVGLATALTALRALGFDLIEVFLSGLILASWAHPAYKLFEPSLWFMAFAATVWLMLNPAPLSAFVVGVAAGGALLVGFNFFLYLGASLLVLWVVPTPGGVVLKDLSSWAGLGVLSGATPFLAYCCVPGVAGAFFERRIRSIVARGTTNLPLPIPWPWREPPMGAGPSRPRQITFQLLFLSLLLLPPLALAWVVVEPAASSAHSRAGVIAAATLGVVGWHPAFSRADVSHLAQSMAPLVLLVCCFSALLPTSTLVLIGLAAGSWATMLPLTHFFQQRQAPGYFESMRIGSLDVWAIEWETRLVERVSELCREERRGGDGLLALPLLVSLYPILGLKAPVYDTYCVFPADEAAQQRMIAAIRAADVRIAVIYNLALDQREDLRFSATHPLVMAYLLSEMERLENHGLPSDLQLFRAKRASPLVPARESV